MFLGFCQVPSKAPFGFETDGHALRLSALETLEHSSRCARTVSGSLDVACRMGCLLFGVSIYLLQYTSRLAFRYQVRPSAYLG